MKLDAVYDRFYLTLMLLGIPLGVWWSWFDGPFWAHSLSSHAIGGAIGISMYRWARMRRAK